MVLVGEGIIGEGIAVNGTTGECVPEEDDCADGCTLENLTMGCWRDGGAELIALGGCLAYGCACCC